MKLNFQIIREVMQGEILRLYRESHKTLYNSQEFNNIALKMGLLREQVNALEALENLTKPLQIH